MRASAASSAAADSANARFAPHRAGAIATRRGYCDWTVDHAGWVVFLLSPDEQEFYGRTLEEALAWCLVWLMAPEIGVGPFVV